jgi:hypothetical protein
MIMALSDRIAVIYEGCIKELFLQMKQPLRKSAY